jgi:hypothetical protein
MAGHGAGRGTQEAILLADGSAVCGNHSRLSFVDVVMFLLSMCRLEAIGLLAKRAASVLPDISNIAYYKFLSTICKLNSHFNS